MSLGYPYGSVPFWSKPDPRAHERASELEAAAVRHEAQYEKELADAKIAAELDRAETIGGVRQFCTDLTVAIEAEREALAAYQAAKEASLRAYHEGVAAYAALAVRRRAAGQPSPAPLPLPQPPNVTLEAFLVGLEARVVDPYVAPRDLRPLANNARAQAARIRAADEAARREQDEAKQRADARIAAANREQAEVARRNQERNRAIDEARRAELADLSDAHRKRHAGAA